LFLEIQPFHQMRSKSAGLNGLSGLAKRGKRIPNTFDLLSRMTGTYAATKQRATIRSARWQYEIYINTVFQKPQPKRDRLFRAFHTHRHNRARLRAKFKTQLLQPLV